MNEKTISAAIDDLKSAASTCCNGISCISLLLIVRRFFFSLPAKEHTMFIDIAEGDHRIFFDNDACAVAMQKCTHPNDFDALSDVDFSNVLTPSGAGRTV